MPRECFHTTVRPQGWSVKPSWAGTAKKKQKTVTSLQAMCPHEGANLIETPTTQHLQEGLHVLPLPG